MSEVADGKAQGAIGGGVRKGLESSWELIKVIAPVSIAVTALSHTPLLPWISTLFEPLMSWLGLSGEAAVVLVAGNAVGLYPAIGAMASLDFSAKELLILSLMLSFSHNLFVETAVTKRLGVSYAGVMAYRVGLALVAALIVNALFGWFPVKGTELAGGVGLVASGPEAVVGGPGASASGAEAVVGVPGSMASGPGALVGDALGMGVEAGAAKSSGRFAAAVDWVMVVLVDAADDLFRTIALLVAIIIPLMIIIEFLKERGLLERLSGRIEPYMGWLGMSGKAGFPLLAGFVFGLAYGAGVILDAAKENDLTQGDRRLLCVFLVACHAAIEDTVLFIPLGVNPFVLLGTRIGLALLLTIGAARTGVGARPHARPPQPI